MREMRDGMVNERYDKIYFNYLLKYKPWDGDGWMDGLLLWWWLVDDDEIISSLTSPPIFWTNSSISITIKIDKRKTKWF